MGKVSKFRDQLFQNSPAKFAQWRKIDLHNHSPTSRDYKGDSSTAVEMTALKILEADLSVVMFTDHEKLPELAFVRELAAKTKRLIIRGVELNVFVDIWDKPEGKVGKNLFFHLLVGFDPEGQHSPDYWLTDLYKRCKAEKRMCGNTEITGVTASIAEVAKIVREEAVGILIPAHLHSTRDAFRSRSIDDLFKDEEFLKYAKECFTALEVTDPNTATYFDGKHSETRNLEKTCIQSSDSHEPEEIGRRTSFAQMENVSFSELKAALEMPFRVSIAGAPIAGPHIVGLRIVGQFFSDLWLSFSPHCNILIGVKGSGKTSVLECLRFALGTAVPSSRVDAVNGHLQNILGMSGKVQVLIKRPDGALALVDRAFANQEFNLTFEDDRTETISDSAVLLFPAQILGWHEIEQAATDPNIRRIYLDSIGGRETLRQLKEAAVAEANQVRSLHDIATSRYSSYRAYADQIKRLEEQRKGLQELTNGQLIEMKNQFEAAVRHRDAVSNFQRRITQALAEADQKTSALRANMSRSVFEGDSPVSGKSNEAMVLLDQLNAHIDGASSNYNNQLMQVQARLSVIQDQVNHSFNDFHSSYTDKVSNLPEEMRHILESHQRVMEETGALDRLKIEQSSARSETISILNELAGRCDRIAELLDRRADIRRTKVNELNDELSEFNVHLSVGTLAGQTELDELSRRFQLGYSAYTKLSDYAPGVSRNHRRLAKAYRDLVGNISGGFGAIFETAEYGHFLSYFEEDDLKIALRVGKSGEEFSPIDQLSAGQRCTAIFPLLLRLKVGPLIVDQPEDNLDNRHIAGTISPALLHDKRNRQIAFTSHNANLVVLSDAEHIVVFESTGSQGRIEARGFLSSKESSITRDVIDIVDGGEHALQLRSKKYGNKG